MTECLVFTGLQPRLESQRKDVEQGAAATAGDKAGTNEDLVAGVGKALYRVSANDAQGWFRSCGHIQS